MPVRRAVQARHSGTDGGATLPALPWVAASLLAAGVVALAGGIVLLVIPIRRASS